MPVQVHSSGLGTSRSGILVEYPLLFTISHPLITFSQYNSLSNQETLMQATTEGTPETGASSRQSRVFYGWWIVVAASIQGMFGNGTISSGFPIFFLPIRETLGINYTQMSLVFGLARAEGGMGGPLVGWLADRYGSRPLIIFGGFFAAIGMILLSQATEYWQLVVLFVGVVSIGKTAGLGQTLMATVNHWFIRRRAVAMSTLMTAFAGGGAIVVPLLGWGIAGLGWRETLLYSGIFVAVLSLPVCLVIRSKPEDLGLLPDGDRRTRPGPASASPAEPPTPGEEQRAEFTVRQTLRTRAFWLIMLAVATRVSATNGVIVHLFPILADEGLGPQTAAFYASLMFFMAIPLRFLLGVAGDKLAPRKLLFIGMNLGAVAVVTLLITDSVVGVVIFVLCMAVVEGVTSANWIMVGDYFGRGRFASLMGFMSVFHNIGLIVVPIYAGWIRDTTGSYNVALATLAPLFVVSAFAFALARRPPPPRMIEQPA